MSQWGRAQDAVHDVLWGHDYDYGSKHQPGAFEKLGITAADVREKCPSLTEDLLEAIAPVFRPTNDELVRRLVKEQHA
jgi:hypothetical protein